MESLTEPLLIVCAVCVYGGILANVGLIAVLVVRGSSQKPVVGDPPSSTDPSGNERAVAQRTGQ